MFRRIKNIFTKDYPVLDEASEGFEQVANSVTAYNERIKKRSIERKIELTEESKLHKTEHEEKMVELKRKEELLIQQHNKEYGTNFSNIDEVINYFELKVEPVADILNFKK